MIGTMYLTEIVDPAMDGRKAFQQRRSLSVSAGGVVGSENSGLSNDKHGQNPCRRKDKVS